MWKEIKDKSIVIFDAETDGFLDDMTTVHCIVLIDARTNEVFRYRDPKEACDKLQEYDVAVAHNGIGFDFPMLKQECDWDYKGIILDTLWMSRLYHCDIEGGHSLDAWGQRLGEPKTEYYPVLDPAQPLYNSEEPNPKKNPCWKGSVWSQLMEDYCEQDNVVTVKLFWKLVNLLKNFTWMSVKCEMDTAVIIQRQMQHGFVFDYQAAERLHGTFIDRIGELEDEVHETFKPLPKKIREIQPKIKADGTVSSVGLKKLPDWEKVIVTPEHTRTEEDLGGGVMKKSVEYHSGSFTLIEFPEFSLGSRAQIAERLTKAGYKLTEFTEKGTPMINDEVLKIAADAGIPEAKPLAEYFMITKREGMVKDWLSKAVWVDGIARIHGYVNSLGAATNRMTHSSPNVAQVPSSSSPYGDRCRSLFTVRPGYKLVGCDADGLELRCLAHYMGDLQYALSILEGKKSDGTDIHTLNQKAAGLLTRDQAKTFIYAFLYGAGDAKIGQIVGGGAKEGKALKKKFLEATPALKKLRDGIAQAVSQRKWVKGIDGRIIRVRSPHAALNTLLQGMGAIVMKYWLIEVTTNADAAGLDWNPSANVHDEGQFEVLEKDVPKFKEICEAAFYTVSDLLKLKCICTGTADHGDTWLETH
jgi:hypothetical protein